MNILKNITYTLTIFSTSLYSLSIDELKDMPKSRERDFYIWKFLKEPTTTKELAIEASSLIFHKNRKLDNAFFKKSGVHLPKRVYKPKKVDLSKYTKLISSLYKSGDFYKAWLKLSTHDKLIVFAHGGKEVRKILNEKIDEKLYQEFQKDRLINQLIYRAKRENLTHLKELIENTKPVDGNKIRYKTLMKLAYKYLLNGDKEKASWFFGGARYNAPTRFYADNAIFWQYMTTKDKKYLVKLSKSYDYNIYKLYALDLLNKPYPTPPNLNIMNNKANIDITDPIAWARLKEKIFSKKTNLFALASKYNSTETSAYYYYIMNKAYKDTKQFFPIPYKDILKNYPVDRQALILAIARQESQFIPASVSISFAVGMMQFMPFLVKEVSKKRKESVELEEMFKPRVALKFANTHLDYLNKHLYHPLFVAYAYNAGIGFTRKLIRNKKFFKNGEYEPFLSIEMVKNDEARYYAKRVLGNYVIYKKLLGSPVKITTLLNQLDKPHLTDRFRKKTK